jgi:hypothetical protein
MTQLAPATALDDGRHLPQELLRAALARLLGYNIKPSNEAAETAGPQDSFSSP